MVSTYNLKRLYRSGMPCHWCRIPMTLSVGDNVTPTSATREHIITQESFRKLKDVEKQKEKDHSDNVVLACAKCNNLRGNTSPEIFELFARVILRQYPYAPAHFLRAALRQFKESLAEIAIRNKKESMRAISLALLSLSDMMEK